MPITNYYSIEGEIEAMKVGSSPRVDLLPDALGSAVTVTDVNRAVKRTARWAPYGAQVSSSGSVYEWGWAGAQGYRRTCVLNSDLYVRARHYSTRLGRWTTVDPLWPSEKAYAYVEGNPATWTDPTGLVLGGVLGSSAVEVWGGDIISHGATGTVGRSGGFIGKAGRVAGELGKPQGEIVVPPVAYPSKVADGCVNPDTTLTFPTATEIGRNISRAVGGSRLSYYRATRVRKARDCNDAKNGIVHKNKPRGSNGPGVCDDKMKPPDWKPYMRKSDNSISDEQKCMDMREYMSRARDCYKARLQLERLCGFKDQKHVDMTQAYKNAWINVKEKFQKYGCERILWP